MEKVVFISEGQKLYGTLYTPSSSQFKAVVFCHGAFEYQDNWSDFAQRLVKQGIDSFTFDFVGHGESEGLRSLVNMHIWAYNIRDALNFLNSKGYQRFALVGWGSGGSAVVLASAHDRRVACSVAISTPIYLVPPLGERIAIGLVVMAGRLKKAIWKKTLTLSRINEIKEMRFAIDKEANEKYISDPRFRGYMEAVPVVENLDQNWLDITKAACKVSVPVLVIHGMEDSIVPVDQSRRLLETLQGRKKLHLVKESGHAVHLDIQRDEVYGLIAKWVMQYLQ